ncbi:MAG: hypothetical protein Kow0059_20560 [Candidatus Sumerlaeia bacterium]
MDWGGLRAALGIHLTTLQPVTLEDLWTGLLLLALPQVRLSLGDSLIGTRQTVTDLFPERSVSVRKIGVTFAAASLLAPLFSGIPVCHGCSGLAGHHAMGGRSGGSVVLYGCYYVVAGLPLGDAVNLPVAIFPKPIMGAVLLLEALALMVLVRDVAVERRNFMLMLIVTVLALGTSQGVPLAMLIGVALHVADRRWNVLARQGPRGE